MSGIALQEYCLSPQGDSVREEEGHRAFLHQSFETTGPGDSSDIAGLKYHDLTSDEPWQCPRCAGVLILAKMAGRNNGAMNRVLPAYSKVYPPGFYLPVDGSENQHLYFGTEIKKIII